MVGNHKERTVILILKNPDLKWVCNLEKPTGIESCASSKPASLGTEGPRGDPVAQFSAQTPDPRKPGGEAGWVGHMAPFWRGGRRCFLPGPGIWATSLSLPISHIFQTTI